MTPDVLVRIESAQQQFDREMDEAGNDLRLIARAQVRHNSRVWSAAVAQVMEIAEEVKALRVIITDIQARHQRIDAWIEELVQRQKGS